MPKTVTTVLVFILLSSATAAPINSTDKVDNNALVLIYRFVDAFYPNVSRTGGEIAVRAYFGSEGVLASHLVVTVRECLVSGVPGQAYKDSAPRSCGIPTDPDLGMTINLNPSSGRPPIESVYVAQQVLREKEAQIRALMTSHNIEQALEDAGAKFVPSKRKEFVSTIPSREIEEFTGCVLDLKSTQFDSESNKFKWVVSGRRAGTNSLCAAEFEPFEGRLRSIS